ncbi:MAG: rhomboid family intramembrane serine protease [Salaquimonas sp.]
MAKVNESAENELPETEKRQPLFNVPGIISVFAALIIAIHFVREYLLPGEWDNQLLYLLAFFPASYGALTASAPFPWSGLWSPVTHSLLHGSWLHVIMNLIWMAAFGSPMAKRFGTLRFIILTIICSCGGALLHYLTAENPYIPIIGASGAIAGYMGAASRFIFNSPSGRMQFRENAPALSLVQCFLNKQFLLFFGLWMGMNYLFGAGFIDFTGQGNSIAWQAHIGGFLAGLLIFDLLERPRIRTH